MRSCSWPTDVTVALSSTTNGVTVGRTRTLRSCKMEMGDSSRTTLHFHVLDGSRSFSETLSSPDQEVREPGSFETVRPRPHLSEYTRVHHDGHDYLGFSRRTATHGRTRTPLRPDDSEEEVSVTREFDEPPPPSLSRSRVIGPTHKGWKDQRLSEWRRFFRRAYSSSLSRPNLEFTVDPPRTSGRPTPTLRIWDPDHRPKVDPGDGTGPKDESKTVREGPTPTYRPSTESRCRRRHRGVVDRRGIVENGIILTITRQESKYIGCLYIIDFFSYTTY